MSVELSGANEIPSSLSSPLQTPASTQKPGQLLKSCTQEMKYPDNPVVNGSSDTTKQNHILPPDIDGIEKKERNIINEDNSQNSKAPSENEPARASKKKKTGRRRRVTANLSGTKYEVGKYLYFITDEGSFIFLIVIYSKL